MTKFILSVLIIFLSLNANALTNSKPAESEDFKSVVFFMATQFDKKGGDEGMGMCNGNLISARMMITAAHCVFMAEVSGKREMQVEVGEYRYRVRNSEVFRVGYIGKIKEKINGKVYLPSELKAKADRQKYGLSIGPGNDIAVVVFERDLPLPADFKFAQVATQAEIKAITSQITNFYPTVVNINYVEEMSTDTKRMARLESLKKNFSGYLESKSNSRVQPGDSGSPLFVRIGSQWKQIGVTKGRAETLITSWDMFGLLDENLCDISRQLSNPQDADLLCK